MLDGDHMGIAPIKHYGVKEQLAAADELEVKLQELDLCGYTVMHSGFSEAVLSDLRERLLSGGQASRRDTPDMADFVIL